MKLALIQQAATNDRNANLERGIAAARIAAESGAKVICFAELAFDRFYPQNKATDELLKMAVSIPGPSTDPFCEIARQHECVIVPNFFEDDGSGQTFDSSPVIDADGSILGITRMIHITDYPCFHEQGYYEPGNNGVPGFRHPPRKDWRSNLLRSPFSRIHASARRGRRRVDHRSAGWRRRRMARGALRSGDACCRLSKWLLHCTLQSRGEEECLTFAGESFVCDPDGRTIARAAQNSEEILYCEIDFTRIAECHAKQLFLQHRRPELYAGWINQ